MYYSKHMTETLFNSTVNDSTLTGPKPISRNYIRIGDVMSRNMAAVSPHDNLADVTIKTTQADFSCILVTNNDNVVGILAERILRKIVAIGEDPCAKVSDVMSTAFTNVSAHLSVLDASRIMREKQVKQLLVANGEYLIGVVTESDIMRALRECKTIGTRLQSCH